MKRPADMASYRNLIEQVLDEIIDLKSAVENGAEFTNRASPIIDRLESELREHLNQTRQTHYLFGGGDLPFMDIVDSAPRSLLPFAGLLHLINETHRKGLEPAE